MSASLVILRDLPRVAEFEARCNRIAESPSGAWCSENDGIDQDADRLSMRLFGISYEDTQYLHDHELSVRENERAWSEWERHFGVLETYNDEDAANAELVWNALGWDCNDADGCEMLVLGHIGRQLVCAAKGLRGHLPDGSKSEAEIQADSAKWEQMLINEVAGFHRRPLHKA